MKFSIYSFLFAILFAVPVHAAITLPIEVLGPAGTIESVTINVPAGGSSAIDGLWMQINNLSYPNALVPFAKGSVQINNGPWTDLTNTNVQIQGLAKNWEGIGGPFNTIKMILPIPSGTVVDGDNTITFRFNQTDGVSAGYRVINLYFTAGGNPVPLNTTFTNDDPSQWTAPADGNAANGQALWQGSKPLIGSPLPNAPMITARCMDCHSSDGRDLKYFNFSNNSIHARAVFHGLSDQDGEDLAAYIRGLSVYQSINGRPWNPPYQPGPGLDSQPIQEWSAGAGINAVLENDQAIIPYLFPGGNITEAAISATASPQTEHSIRNIPTAMQFLDWNHWLPRVHPKDVWSDFESSVVALDYYGLRNELLTQGANSSNITNLYQNATYNWLGFANDMFAYQQVKQAPILAVGYTNTTSQQIYSLAQWGQIKSWELMQQFQQEGLGPYVFPPSNGYTIAEPRTWFTGLTFGTSPHMLHMNRDANNIIDGTTSNFLADFWYRLQMVLYSDRNVVDHSPIDWSYTQDFIWNNTQAISNSPDIMQFLTILIKGEEMTNNGMSPDYAIEGWAPNHAFDITTLAQPENVSLGWSQTPSSTRTQILEAVVGAWLDKSLTYPTTDYLISTDYLGPIVSSPTPVLTGGIGSTEFGDRIMGMIPVLRGFGVNEPLLQRVINWAQQLYPNGPWDIVSSTSVVSMPFISYNGEGAYANPIRAPSVVNFEAYWYSSAGPVPVPAGASPLTLYVNGVEFGAGTGTYQYDPNNLWYVFNWPVPTTPGIYTLQVMANFPTGSSLAGLPFTVTVTTGSSSSPPPSGGSGSLPAINPRDLPSYIAINGTLALTNYPDSNVSFVWSFGPPSNNTGAPSVISRSAGTASFSSGVQTNSLSSYGLGTGLYQVSVYAKDSNGNTSPSLTANITLVNGDFSALQVYPDPWRSDKHSGIPMTFANLPLESTLKVFTISGHLVKTFTSTANTATWDLTNDSGDKVASGIYLYLITDGQGNKVHGKLAVIK